MTMQYIDSILKQTGAELDFILALDEYLNLYDTSLEQFIRWKEHEDLLEVQRE